MIDVPIEDLIFVVCTLVGGGLLLVTVLVDDILGGVLDALHIGFDIGGVSLMPLLLGFVSMFGVGGLFATQVLHLHAGPAAIVGTVGGVLGCLSVFVMCTVLRRSAGGLPVATSSRVSINRVGCTPVNTLPAAKYPETSTTRSTEPALLKNETPPEAPTSITTMFGTASPSALGLRLDASGRAAPAG